SATCVRSLPCERWFREPGFAARRGPSTAQSVLLQPRQARAADFPVPLQLFSEPFRSCSCQSSPSKRTTESVAERVSVTATTDASITVPYANLSAPLGSTGAARLPPRAPC